MGRRYLSWSITIKRGAIVFRPSGVLTETLNLKSNVVDPHVLLAEPEVDDGGGVGDIPGAEVPVVELPEPDYRISGKQPPPRLCALKGSGEVGDQRTKVISGWTMRTLIQQQEEKAMNYYHAGHVQFG